MYFNYPVYGTPCEISKVSEVVKIRVSIRRFGNSGNISYSFWRQYTSLFTSIAAIVVPIVDFR